MIALEAARVYLAFAVPGLLAAPLLRRAFPNLRDGGVSVARPLGWALIAWIAWILPSLHLVSYGTPLVFFALLVVGALGGWIGWTDRAAWQAIFRKERNTILAGEGIGLFFFAICVWQVKFNGDIHPLAERFMDYAILKRLEFTTSFPPMDSWLAGKTLQYYYYGYVLMDVLRRIAGMDLRVFFNIAVAAVYATFAMSLWGCGLALARRRFAAAAAVIGAGFVGNFEFPRQIWEIHRRAHVWRFEGLDWFRASRVIPGTINEVPIFSMFWGDLHPYLIAFPVVGLVLCMAIATITSETPPLSPSRPYGDRVLAGLLLALPLGALYPTNSWDFPTFAVVTMSALALPLLPLEPGRWKDPKAWRELVLTCGTVALASVLLYFTFHLGFGKQIGRGVRLAQRRSDAIPMMVHFGPWFLALQAWAIATSRDRGMWARRALPIPATALGLVLYEWFGRGAVAGLVKVMAAKGGILLWLGQGVDHLFMRGLAFVLLVAVLWVLTADLELDDFRTPERKAEAVARGIFTAAISVVLVCEFAYLDDFYGGENERMNTIFKAYIQAWILLGVASSGLLYTGVQAMLRRPAAATSGPRRMRNLQTAGACAMVLGILGPGSCFPLLADYSRSQKFTQTRSNNQPTYDPLNLFEESYPRDAAAVTWIAANLPPDAVILESTAHAYEWESRIASFSGRMSLIGWSNHESGWRNSWTDPLARVEAVKKMYTAETLAEAVTVAREHGVEYVYVGELEQNRAKYPAYRLEKFRELEVLFAKDGVTLYRLPTTKS